MSTRRISNWTRNLIIVAIMLGLWLGVTVGVVWVAGSVGASRLRSANAYWMAAYGAPMCYLVLIGLYALLMRRRRSSR